MMKMSFRKKKKNSTPVFSHGQHTYVYAQVLLSVLATEQKGGHVIRRLQQEVPKEAMKSNHDVTPITLALMAGFQYTLAAQIKEFRKKRT